ncbi:MAG TPA: DNA repair protein RadC [Dehalococcoidia bacterium]|nr:DNA repair protein RadC [Dehalococcoidia bacterium]
MAQPSRPEYNTRIREIPSSDRPRERLRDLGAGALSTAELLAIVLRTGSAKQSVLGLSGSLLARRGGLGGLARLSFSELTREQGLGEAKAAELQAVFELGRRFHALTPEDRALVRAPGDIYALLGGEMELLEQEHLRVVLVNTRNQVIAVTEVYKGNVGSALVRPAEVFREAVRQNAPSIIVVHNHPSGDPSPSPDDVSLTKTLGAAGKLLDIELLDHVIIGDKRFASFSQLGLWPAT